MKRWLLLPMLAVVLAGCGTSQPDIDPQVRSQLAAGVQRLRNASTQGDRLGAEAALASLTRDIAAAQAQGRINQNRARMLLGAADRVSADVNTMDLPAPPAPVTVTATPPPDESTQDGGSGPDQAQRKIDNAKRKMQQKKQDLQNLFGQN